MSRTRGSPTARAPAALLMLSWIARAALLLFAFLFDSAAGQGMQQTVDPLGQTAKSVGVLPMGPIQCVRR